MKRVSRYEFCPASNTPAIQQFSNKLESTGDKQPDCGEWRVNIICGSHLKKTKKTLRRQMWIPLLQKRSPCKSQRLPLQVALKDSIVISAGVGTLVPSGLKRILTPRERLVLRRLTRPFWAAPSLAPTAGLVKTSIHHGFDVWQSRALLCGLSTSTSTVCREVKGHHCVCECLREVAACGPPGSGLGF